MINNLNMDRFLDGQNGDLWESWLTGDILPDEFLRLLKERHADAKETAFAETSVAYDNSFSYLGGQTVDAARSSNEILFKAAEASNLKPENANGSFFGEKVPDNTGSTNLKTEKNGRTTREQALAYFSKYFNEAVPTDGFVVPATIGLISIAFATVGIITNQPVFVWGAVGCGSLLGGFYIIRSMSDSVWNVGTIRF